MARLPRPAFLVPIALSVAMSAVALAEGGLRTWSEPASRVADANGSPTPLPGIPPDPPKPVRAAKRPPPPKPPATAPEQAVVAKPAATTPAIVEKPAATKPDLVAKPAPSQAATAAIPKDPIARKLDEAEAAPPPRPAKAAVAVPAALLQPPKAPVAAPAPAAKGADDSKNGKGAATAGKKEAEKPKLPAAKSLFGAVQRAAPLKARAIGWYAKGCLAGAKAIDIDGPAWQVMRLSRNRMWGHPNLVAVVERLGKEAKAANEWSGLLIGDLSQPRGGPMLTGHASHQVGLDADIWLTPMPSRTLTRREREDVSATSMLSSEIVTVNSKVWGDGQFKLIKRAASYRAVERVLVHPAIKKALCDGAGTDRSWLHKVRPYFGHHYHMHIRIGCPDGSANCRSQPPPPDEDGCGKELTDWLKRVTPKKKPDTPPVAGPPSKPKQPKPEITLADLPPECGPVLTAGGTKVEPIAASAVVNLGKDAGDGTPISKLVGD